MNSHLYGILDGDSSYSRLFANYLNNLSRLRNNFIVFTDVDSLINFQHKDDLQILFLDEAFDLSYILKFIDASRIVILSDKGCKNDSCPCPYIVKYDSPESILTRAIKLLSADTLPQDIIKKPASFFKNIVNENTTYDAGISRFIGVYSPYSLDLQTFFALCAGLTLSNNGSVLFLDLSRFSPIHISPPDRGGFSDLIFYYRSNKEALCDKLHTIINSYYNFDYIAPPKTGEDITSFPKDIFSLCLNFLADKFAYNYIIINFGDYLSPLYNYIGTVNKLFVPYTESAISIDSLYSYLHFSGLSQMVPSVTGLPVDYYKSLNYSAAEDLTHLSTLVKAHPLFHQISAFVIENIVKGGMSDDRSNKKESFTKSRYLL